MKEKLNILDSLELLSFQDQCNEYPLHYHDTYCISLVEKGVFGENEFIIPAGGIVISHPQELHVNKLINNIHYSFSTFYVSQDVMNFISRNKQTSFENKVIENSFLFNQLSGLIQFIKMNKLKKNFLQDFYTAFYKIMYQLVYGYGNARPYLFKEASTQLEEVKQYVSNHLGSKIDLNVLARLLGMDKFKFIRWFKMHVGMTPFEYILLKRVGVGKKLIQQGVPLVHVASDAGFYDQSHFSNYFKKYIGMSPKVYSKSCNIFQDF